MKRSIRMFSLILSVLTVLGINDCCAAAAAGTSATKALYMTPWEEGYHDPALVESMTRRQSERLEADSEFTRGKLRLVKSSEHLTVGYGVSTGTQIPELKLSKEIYDQLREIGVTVKVLLGYLKGLDGSLTPDDINVVVPYISSVQQASAGTAPKLVPLGFLRKHLGDAAVVLLSGNQGNEHKGIITQFFNTIYKRDGIPYIQVMDAADVGDMYIPHVIQDGLKLLEFHAHKYLEEEILKRVISTYPLIANSATQQERFRKNINISARILMLLINEDYKALIAHYKSLNFYRENCWEGDSLEMPSEEEESTLRKFIYDHKNDFIKAAVFYIKACSKDFDEASREKLHKLLSYLEMCIFPDMASSSTLEQRKGLWKFIKQLPAGMCRNPDSNPNSGYDPPKITIAERLRKRFSGRYGYRNYDDSASHTEQFLVKLIRSNPSMLTHGLKCKKTAAEVESSKDIYPRFLGYVIDSFSWLDVCNGCAGFLHTNPIWAQALSEVETEIRAKGYNVHESSIDSLFRFISQHDYNGLPLNLGNAGGGHNYLEQGWDFRFLSKERITLSTRFSWRDLKYT